MRRRSVEREQIRYRIEPTITTPSTKTRSLLELEHQSERQQSVHFDHESSVL
jgi:hypothetical protein